MDPLDAQKTSFMSTHVNYYYNVMLSNLKNTNATYQRLMDGMFPTRLGET